MKATYNDNGIIQVVSSNWPRLTKFYKKLLYAIKIFAYCNHLVNVISSSLSLWLLPYYLNILIGFGIIGQTVSNILPGKSSHSFYICVGRVPSKFAEGHPVKFNASYYIILLISALCHIFVFFNFLINKLKEKMKKNNRPVKRISLQFLSFFNTKLGYSTFFVYRIINRFDNCLTKNFRK